MSRNFRFAIVSDPHIALPHTIWDHPSRFHLVEVSIPALEVVLAELEPLNLDFLLIPGDLTQHGEPDNHTWLAQRLAQLPYPVYVVPGNHDVPERDRNEQSIGLGEFASYYEKFGYLNPAQPYYHQEILPGVQLIGLNSNFFCPEGKQIGTGRLDQMQFDWLKETIAHLNPADLVLVMIHHNVIEHLPGQSHNPMGRRYMLDNAPDLLYLLQTAGIQLIFTGHLHVQDIAHYSPHSSPHSPIYEITTGSLVSYPHPYRILTFQEDDRGNRQLTIESGRVRQVPGWDDLAHLSREWMGDRSFPFMSRFLSLPPFNLSPSHAAQYAPALRYFWADVANGDAVFHFPDLPAEINQWFTRFSALDKAGQPQFIDNSTTLHL